MKQRSLGILAHVDAGKTTLSEGMLYLSGCLKKLGRVDHQDAFLDTNIQERERGITIFAKQAVLPLGETEVTLLDTPGHVDFSAEMERTLQVMDCAILVISGVDGIQGHTETLWRLLERYQLPVFIYVNKMDLAGADRDRVLAQLQSRFSEGCVDFTQPLGEEAALCDEALLECYLEGEPLPKEEILRVIGERKLFPVYFGAALKLEGIEELLEGLDSYCPQKQWGEAFGARVFKISRDPQGNRLTWMKITGGSLKVKTQLNGTTKGESWTEKADQLRRYSGAKFTPIDRAEAGMICAVTGLTQTFPGQGLGCESGGEAAVLEPVLNYQVILPEGADPHTVLKALRLLEEEDPQLHVLWNEQLREIHIQLMGPVQREVLAREVERRFQVEIGFGKGNIVYRETLTEPVTGVGHFEPLRHYAEVHLLLEPGPRGSGITWRSACSEDQLDLNWQRLIYTHVFEREHIGVLTGSPLTDVKVTLLNGRAHLKHTEGGDFRQSTYRAIRNALRRGKSRLLEPWYQFRMDLPADCLGRAMSDMQQRSGELDAPELYGDQAVLSGSVPVAAMGEYAAEMMSYTKGRGQLSCQLKGYYPCHNEAEVIERLGYDPDADLENTADSVFCAHGSGFVVRWDQVEHYQHLETPDVLGQKEVYQEELPIRTPPPAYTASDEELLSIFEQTYGKVKRKRAFDSPVKEKKLPDQVTIKPPKITEEYLLVDGYNIIFAWDDLNRLAKDSMEQARQRLMDDLCSYQSYKKCNLILVFDAYRVKGGQRKVEKYHNIHVVYTQEAETADQYIEKASYKLGKHYRVRVATSDGIEQCIVLGHGCFRESARTFKEELDQVLTQQARLLRDHNIKQAISGMKRNAPSSK